MWDLVGAVAAYCLLWFSGQITWLDHVTDDVTYCLCTLVLCWEVEFVNFLFVWKFVIVGYMFDLPLRRTMQYIGML